MGDSKARSLVGSWKMKSRVLLCMLLGLDIVVGSGEGPMVEGVGG